MSASRLELVSNHGDQTLSRARFVLHGTIGPAETETITSSGLSFVEGKPVVTTNIVHAHDWTRNAQRQSASSPGESIMPAEPGRVLVFAIPPSLHVGYGIFTTSYVDRALKRVGGAPLRYAASRNQLAFYESPDTEASRVHVEAEVANGYALDQRSKLLLDPRNLIGSFEPVPGFDAMVRQLDVVGRSLQPIDFLRIEASLREIFQVTDPANEVLAPTAIRDVIVGTVESVLISRLRMMRWEGLALLGYRFNEGKETVEIPSMGDMTQHRRNMEELSRQLASSSLFGAELSWLKTYGTQQLTVMRVELDGAEA